MTTTTNRRTDRRPSGPQTPTIDVVVVTYNSEHVVGELLDSLPAALDGLAAEVVVVDNGSTDGTASLLARRPDCRVVAGPNVGYAAGINRGVAELHGDGPILVLNPDVRLMPGAVAALLRALQTPHTGIAAPRVLDASGALSLSLRREPTLGRALGLSRTGRPGLTEKVSDPSAYDAPTTADWALGAVLLVARATYDALGGWDESFFLYSEETDFCLRARDLGLVTRYTPDAVCTHIGGQSGTSGLTHAMQIVNRVRLYRRRNGVLRGWAYYCLAVASEASWVLRGQRRSATALLHLLSPRRRASELGCSDRVLPR